MTARGWRTAALAALAAGTAQVAGAAPGPALGPDSGAPDAGPGRGAAVAPLPGVAPDAGPGRGAAVAQLPGVAPTDPAEIDAMASEIARLRGLAFRRPLALAVLGRDAIRARLDRVIERQLAPAAVDAEARVYRRLGLLPAGSDYRALYLDAAADQLAGFYDPWARELVLAETLALPGGDGGRDGRLVVAHELAHALQDQHVELCSFMALAADQGDAGLARQALVEGEAMALMIEFAFDQLGRELPWGDPAVTEVLGAAFADGGEPRAAFADGGEPRAAEVPAFLRELRAFPYERGLAFVAELRRYRAWRAVDGVFRRPPLSTEHILHPEAYWAYERPVAVAIPHPLAVLAPASLVYTNVLGEAGLAALLAHHGVDAATAAAAAWGWGGDRIAAFAAPAAIGADPAALPAPVVVAVSVWDTEIDAIEFFDAARAALPSIAGGGALRARGPQAVVCGADDDLVALERAGDRVALIIGVREAELERVLASILGRRGRR